MKIKDLLQEEIIKEMRFLGQKTPKKIAILEKLSPEEPQVVLGDGKPVGYLWVEESNRGYSKFNFYSFNTISNIKIIT